MAPSPETCRSSGSSSCIGHNAEMAPFAQGRDFRARLREAALLGLPLHRAASQQSYGCAGTCPSLPTPCLDWGLARAPLAWCSSRASCGRYLPSGPSHACGMGSPEGLT